MALLELGVRKMSLEGEMSLERVSLEGETTVVKFPKFSYFHKI